MDSNQGGGMRGAAIARASSARAWLPTKVGGSVTSALLIAVLPRSCVCLVRPHHWYLNDVLGHKPHAA